MSATEDSGSLNGTKTIVHTASGGGYDSVSTASLTVTEMDNEKALLLHDGNHNDISSLTINEGNTATYHVELGDQPDGNVTVTLSVGTQTNSIITINKTSLTFTRDNWSTGQVVTVTSATDGNTANDAVSVSHTASGGGFDNAPSLS